MSEHLIQAFCEMILVERGGSPHTIEAYRRDLLQYAQFITSIHVEILSAQEHDVRNFIVQLHNQHLSTTSINRKISVLRQFYMFLHHDNIMEYNPTEGLVTRKSSRKLPNILSYEQIKLLLSLTGATDNPKDIRMHAIIHLIYASGMRISELVTLSTDTIQYETKSRSIMPYLVILGKGNKERLVPIYPKAITALEALYINTPYFYVF